MSNRAPAGALFVISAPSGTGKTTVVDRLVERLPNLVRSRSYTSRPRRPGEVDGVDYNFVSRDRFEAMVRAGEFLEWADIFGNLYGTRRQDIEDLLADGHDVVLVIDVQGARQVRERLPGRLVGPFHAGNASLEQLPCPQGGNGDELERIERRSLGLGLGHDWSSLTPRRRPVSAGTSRGWDRSAAVGAPAWRARPR
jgi:guanylate kinase